MERYTNSPYFVLKVEHEALDS